MKFLRSNLKETSRHSSLTDDWHLIYTMKKNSFTSLKLLVEVIIACSYAFGLGYSLSFFDNIIETGLIFLILLISSYLIVLIPHELLHAICYKSKNNVIIKYVLLKLKFVSCLNGTISKENALLLLILPFITLSIIPSIISYLFGFNLFLYALASANAIKSSVDLLNFTLILKNVPSNTDLVIDYNDIYLKSITTNKLIPATKKINKSTDLNITVVDSTIISNINDTINEPKKEFIVSINDSIDSIKYTTSDIYVNNKPEDEVISDAVLSCISNAKKRVATKTIEPISSVSQVNISKNNYSSKKNSKKKSNRNSKKNSKKR